jgi:hypothetical protein
MQVPDDSDGVHKSDHTRGVDRKQLDDGVGRYVRIGRMMVRELHSHFLFLGDTTARPMPTVM